MGSKPYSNYSGPFIKAVSIEAQRQEYGQTSEKGLNIFVLNTHEAIAQLPFTLFPGYFALSPKP